ncbi:sulfotransferase family 2 domain-containing protein [uncultured Planktosalinus sp.]|uniref:sulfotransferase family 2 domain-containing protein n=1 Tax=uncultured Planktosalinus sp. TaxID=1810935 RepID=UPI0030D903EF
MLEIIHIHIPKTAGTSLLNVLQKKYSSNEICTIKRKELIKNSIKDNSEIIKNHISKEHKILHGHLHYKEIDFVLKMNKDVKIITFLRNPVDRVVSNYLFFKQRIIEGKVNKSELSRKNETLMEYARLEESQNRQSKFLDGIDLEKIYFLGVMESFSEDIKNLCKKLEINLFEIPDLNKNKHFEISYLKITETEIQEIKSLNQNDLLLYQKALEIRHSKQVNK